MKSNPDTPNFLYANLNKAKMTKFLKFMMDVDNLVTQLIKTFMIVCFSSVDMDIS
jgi:hypothetical protein